MTHLMPKNDGWLRDKYGADDAHERDDDFPFPQASAFGDGVEHRRPDDSHAEETRSVADRNVLESVRHQDDQR